MQAKPNSTRTDSLLQQALYAVYDGAMQFAESHLQSSLTCIEFLEASQDTRHEIFDDWDKAGRPAVHTQALADFIREYFKLPLNAA